MPLKQTSLGFEFENSEPEKRSVLKPPTEVTSEEQAPIDLADAVSFRHEDTAAAGSARKSPRGRMKLSDMNASAELVEVPEDKILFEKRYYSIGAVSEMFKVNQSLIRFWENEFSILKPKKNGKGDRFFRPEDVKNLKLIYHLLRERKYTIEGAKEFLKKKPNADKKFEMIESLKNLKAFLLELKAGL